LQFRAGHIQRLNGLEKAVTRLPKRYLRYRGFTRPNREASSSRLSFRGLHTTCEGQELAPGPLAGIDSPVAD
jgi:hypothetical protein